MAKRKTSTKAPVELLPLIASGMWVRFAAAQGVPDHLVGRDGVVLRAASHLSEGSKKGPAQYPHEYQEPGDLFLVQARDTGETLTLSREAFAAFDSERVRLAVAG